MYVQEFVKRIEMKQYIKWLPVLMISLGSSTAFSQQTYLSQHNQTKGESSQLSSDLDAGVFVGCVDYSIRYLAVPTDNVEQREKAEFAATETEKSYGDERTVCFNANGDWLHIYRNGELIDRVWYFADSNEEYTFFKTGVLKFFVTDTAEPEGFSELGFEQIERTEQKRNILGYDTVKVTATRKSGTVDNYWVSEDLVRNPASYNSNNFAYANQLYNFLKGVPLYHEKTVSNFMTTVLEAKEIRENEPSVDLFKLPEVVLYHW
jgi:hypothetical protein